MLIILTHRLKGYFFTLFFVLFLCIGAAHAKKIEKLTCYSTDKLGNYINLEGKPSATPILEWVKENGKWIIVTPSPTTDLETETRTHSISNFNYKINIIKFTHKYSGKTPLLKKIVEMTDKWELVQHPPVSNENKQNWDLTITLDTKHNISSKTPMEINAFLECIKTEVELQENEEEGEEKNPLN
ncbi:MAG: hypothetical protein K0R14_1589 [Burkholderiales bacterium]|jgi:hypothetical protein|nr:hypothetical protein [Burkholderiales bacterium]